VLITGLVIFIVLLVIRQMKVHIVVSISYESAWSKMNIAIPFMGKKTPPTLNEILVEFPVLSFGPISIDF
jgi:hypothetical protein